MEMSNLLALREISTFYSKIKFGHFLVIYTVVRPQNITIALPNNSIADRESLSRPQPCASQIVCVLFARMCIKYKYDMRRVMNYSWINSTRVWLSVCTLTDSSVPSS